MTPIGPIACGICGGAGALVDVHDQRGRRYIICDRCADAHDYRPDTGVWGGQQEPSVISWRAAMELVREAQRRARRALEGVAQ